MEVPYSASEESISKQMGNSNTRMSHMIKRQNGYEEISIV